MTDKKLFLFLVIACLCLGFEAPCFGHPDILASVKIEDTYRLVVLSWNSAKSIYENRVFLALGDADTGTPASYTDRIAFTSNRAGKYDIYLLEAGRQDPQNLTAGFTGNFSDPSFVNKDSLVCAGNVAGINSVFLLDFTKGTLENLTPRFANAGQPSTQISSGNFVFTGIIDNPPTYNGNTDIYLYSDKDNSITRITGGDPLVNESYPYYGSDFILYGAATGHLVNSAFIVEKSDIFRHDPVSGETVPITQGKRLRSSPVLHDEMIYYLVMESLSDRNLYFLEDGHEVKATDDLFIASFCIMGK